MGWLHRDLLKNASVLGRSNTLALGDERQQLFALRVACARFGHGWLPLVQHILQLGCLSLRVGIARRLDGDALVEIGVAGRLVELGEAVPAEVIFAGIT